MGNESIRTRREPLFTGCATARHVTSSHWAHVSVRTTNLGCQGDNIDFVFFCTMPLMSGPPMFEKAPRRPSRRRGCLTSDGHGGTAVFRVPYGLQEPGPLAKPDRSRSKPRKAEAERSHTAPCSLAQPVTHRSRIMQMSALIGAPLAAPARRVSTRDRDQRGPLS